MWKLKNINAHARSDSCIELAGTFVHSIGFGDEAADVKNSYLGNVNDQVQQWSHLRSQDNAV